MTAVVFPGMPNALEPYRLRVAHSTDVLTSYQGYEQRLRLRRIPRRQESFVVRSRTTSDMARLDALGQGGQIQQWILPYWPHGSFLTAAAGPGASSLLCDTADRDFVNGGLVVLWSDTGTFEAATITSLSAGNIGATLAGAWGKGTTVLPGRLARWGADPATTRIMRAGADAPVTFDLEGLSDPGVATPSTPPIFTVAYPDRFRQLPGDLLVRSVARFDSPTGAFVDVARGPDPIGRHTLALWLASKADVNALLTWYYGQKGARGAFLLPTFQADFDPIADIGSGDTSITIREQGYTAFAFPSLSRRTIALYGVNGTIAQRLVTAAVNNGNGTETLTLDAAAGIAVPLVGGMVSLLLSVRLADDPLSIDWIGGGLAQSALQVIEIRPVNFDLVPATPPPPASGGSVSPPTPPPAITPPTAVTNGPYAAQAGDTVHLSAAGSSDPYGGITVAIDPGLGTGYVAGLTLDQLFAVAGTYTMRAKVTSLTTGKVTIATTTVNVAGTPAVVDHVVLSCPNIGGQVGETDALTAVAYDAANHVITGRTVTYVSSNHTVAADPANGPSSAVTYLAAGSTVLHAVVDSISSNNLTAVVTSVPTGGGGSGGGGSGSPSTGGTVDMPHLPAGLNKLFDYEGNGLPGGGTLGLKGTNMAAGAGSFTAFRPGSGTIVSGALDVKYGAGLTPGTSPLGAWFWKSAADEQMTEYYEAGAFQLSGSDFEGPGSSGEWKWLGYWGVALPPGGYDAELYSVLGPAVTTGRTVAGPICTQWQVFMRMQQSAAWSLPGIGLNVIGGKKYSYEIHLKLETAIGAANGLLEFWMANLTDGGPRVKLISSNNRPYRNGNNQAGWWHRSFVPVWGGGGPAPKTRDDHLQLDWCAGFGI